MEFLQLKYFISAAEAESFTQAAKEYSVPVSDISQTIKRLEKELDTSLFTRSANKVSLSREGRIFLESARRIMAELRYAKSSMAQSRSGISGEIRLLVLTNRRVVTEAIEKYHSLYPAVNIVLSHSASDKGDFDIIISDEQPKLPLLRKIPIITEKFYLAVAKSGIRGPENMISGKPELKLTDLRNVPFITMPDNSSHCTMTRKICEEAGFEPKVGIKCDDPYYLRKYVEMGLGAAFVPSFSWKGLISDNIRLIDVSDIMRTTYLFIADCAKDNRAVTEFIPVIEKQCGYAERGNPDGEKRTLI